MRQKKKISLMKIAEKTGLSIATISRVINKKPNVKASTKDIVDKALLDLGYHFNNKEKQNKNKTIAVFVPNLDNPFTIEVLAGIQKSLELSNDNYIVLITKEYDYKIEYYINLVKDLNIDGIISLSAFQSKKTIDKLKNIYPIVMCSENLEIDNVSYVTIDDVNAAFKTINYLIKRKRKNILFINSSLNHKYARKREEGYKKALKANNIEFNEQLVMHLPVINYNLAYTQILAYLKNYNDMEAIFAVSDVYAAAAVEAVKKIGKKIPEDIAIIGFDNTFFSTMVSPKLTTVSQPMEEIGFQSSEILKEEISNQSLYSRKIVLDTNLIIRETTL